MIGEQNESKGKILNSWKEIAEYLDQDPKTCQRWEEKYGLPVRRMQGGKKPRVFAYPEELEEWRRLSSSALTGAPGTPKDAPISTARVVKRRFRPGYLVVILIVLVLAGGFILLSRKNGKSQPADFSIVDHRLVIRDEDGRVLWPFDPRLPKLEGEEFYRLHFQEKRDLSGSMIEGRGNPLLIIRDLNGDRRNEVLFAPKATDSFDSGTVYLFDDRGTEVWRHNIGKNSSFGDNSYSSDFVIGALDARDFLGRGDTQILMIGHSRQQAPTRILLVDMKNVILGEYWNFGQVSDLIVCDLNGDQKPEIILGSQNYEYRRACLIGLNPRLLRGASPQSKPFPDSETGRGEELFYILLPLSKLDQLRSPGNAVIRLDALKNGHIQAMPNYSFLLYDFDARLNLESVQLTYMFESEYKAALLRGEIAEPLDRDKEAIRLRGGLSFWSGADWSDRPTRFDTP